MSGARHCRKGARIEREIVDRHKALGIQAERQHDIAAVTTDIETGSNRARTVSDCTIFALEEDVAAARGDAFHGFG